MDSAAYSDLAAAVVAWPTLPDAIRRAVLAIVQTATPASTGSPAALNDTLLPGYEPRPGG